MVKAHAVRLSIHRELVKKYAKALQREQGGQLSGLVNAAKQHDESKLKQPEYKAYVCINWSHIADDYEPPEACGKATFYHIRNNSHHPEFHAKEDVEFDSWQDDDQNRDMDPSEPIEVLDMPIIDLAHMVCDWAAMSHELGTNTAREWADGNIGDRWLFNNAQSKLIYEYLSIIEERDMPAMDPNWNGLNLTPEKLIPGEKVNV